jgi:hypothetical protein
MAAGRNILELRITNYELRITNYELRITNYELRITNYEKNYKVLIINKLSAFYVLLLQQILHLGQA